LKAILLERNLTQSTVFFITVMSFIWCTSFC
jgi:hypothetical protein